MAVITQNNLTLADWAKRLDPDGTTADVAELLTQTNEILMDASFVEGNLPTGHRVTVRTGLPTVYWRSINQGITPSHSTTAQVDEAAGILEARSEPDKNLVELNGNAASFRFSESTPFLEAMNQTQATTAIYGNPATDPKTYLGLAGRYSSLSAGNAQNILSGGGSGSDNTSVWLVVWGSQTASFFFPKGTRAGLQHRDLGEQTIFEVGGVAGTRMQALVDWYQWMNGLYVKDWRYVVRIPNIDVSDLLALTGTQALTASTSLVKLMVRAIARIPNIGMGRPAFYMNRTVHSGLTNLALDKSSAALSIQDAATQFGKPRQWTSFLGIPLRQVDAIINAEQVVS